MLRNSKENHHAKKCFAVNGNSEKFNHTTYQNRDINNRCVIGLCEMRVPMIR